MSKRGFQPLLRLVPAIILFLTASLAVLPAPTHLLWMMAIGATEWGHALALICLIFAVLLANHSFAGRVASVLSVSAAVLAMTPLLRAMPISRNLPDQLRKAFGVDGNTGRQPLVWGNLFVGVSPPKITPKTLIYGADDEKLALDFYRLASGARSPLIIAIHGGSWNSGDNKDFTAMDEFLAGQGFAVADVLYRLAPRYQFPAASSDVRAAMRFLQDHAETLHFDPNRIVLLGRSAGGQIALHVAYSAQDPAIRGVISFYAPTDLEWSWEHPSNPLVIDTKSALRQYLGGSPVEVPANYRAASPVRLANALSPPTLLFHGGRDELVSAYHSTVLSQRLTELGILNLSVSLPWATHGFDYILRGPGGQLSTYVIESFLKKVFAQNINT